MNYLDMFDDIVEIMHNDYSGCIDKKGWDNPYEYRKKIDALMNENRISDENFRNLILDYISDFRDGHILFNFIDGEKTIRYNCGFKCRRYEDKLYITEVKKEDRVRQGMAIVELDGRPIPELSDRFSSHLMYDSKERQLWDKIMLKFTNCTLEDENKDRFFIDLRKYKEDEYIPEYSLKALDKNISILKLSDFANVDNINSLIEGNKKILNTCRYLIIDVRSNGGGNDSSYYRLLNYMNSYKISLEKLQNMPPMEINYTENNCNISIKAYTDMINDIDDDNTKAILEYTINQLENHKGEGFVEFEDEGFEDIVVGGEIMPEKIVVLSDVYCGSSGDAFVDVAKNCDKVTVMGRGTKGITDYSNLIPKIYSDKFILLYPTSRSRRIDIGEGIAENGVTPDIYIPWTPEHIFKDIDMEKAIEFLVK